MFTSMNAALLVGFVRWARGSQRAAWDRTARAQEATPRTASPAVVPSSLDDTQEFLALDDTQEVPAVSDTPQHQPRTAEPSAVA